MKSKVRLMLFAVVLLFLISNIPVMIGATDYAQDAIRTRQFLFGSDSTHLLVITQIHSLGLSASSSALYTPNPMDPNWLIPVMKLRETTLLLSLVASICLLVKEWKIKQKKIKHILYVGITFFVSIVSSLSLAPYLPGIYDFFRRVKVSYIFAITEPPWLYYYLVILLPMLLALTLVGLDLRKERHEQNKLLKN